MDSKVEISRVASSIRSICTAASQSLGSDCYTHAALGQAVLRRLFVDSRIVTGTVAWRVGPGNSDILLHCPVPGAPPQPGALAFHCWLLIDDKHLFDSTTYQIPAKCKSLDEMDGYRTSVEWHPDYLYADISTVSPLADVIQHRAGMYFYDESAYLHELISSTALPVDEDFVEIALTLYHNPEIKVLGPNQL